MSALPAACGSPAMYLPPPTPFRTWPEICAMSREELLAAGVPRRLMIEHMRASYLARMAGEAK